ncbi:MAG: haloacid dehalogenase-like hydrolase [Sporocytophaga sp.]|uniref:HAD family hydrolase n=1 Tax=Sporocytophaga sp. TaxID=2231183 RepID=UPI001B277D4E|nr:HAD family hydrolase [Sporocytophaga sp.]MBO9700923.1 haloacid dehalogenase-like hydrolase [Sporocytophaga sp.]
MNVIFKRIMLLLLSVATAILFSSVNYLNSIDPLPSWKEGMNKKAILGFVEKVTREGSNDYIETENRIAVFDNDGTLWPEQPLIEGVFLLKTVKAMIAKDPSLKTKEPFKAVIEKDTAFFELNNHKGIMELALAAYGNKTEGTFEKDITTFLQKEKHPRFNVPFTSLGYQPMLELLAFLRDKGFETWICSGGNAEFIRAFSDDIYGVPVQQVIGSKLKLEFKKVDGKHVLWRDTVMQSFNDKEEKPVNISYHIGKVPVFVAGNEKSGGDIAMLTYSDERKGASFQLLINHNDAVREFSYQEKDNASLQAAAANGWNVISIKDDWKIVFKNK